MFLTCAASFGANGSLVFVVGSWYVVLLAAVPAFCVVCLRLMDLDTV